MINSFETEFLGFTIRQSGAEVFVIVHNNKNCFTCKTEKEAKRWIIRFKKMADRTAALKCDDDAVPFRPENITEEPKPNIIAISGSPALETEEKYIKIITKKNSIPVLDIKNLDSNEVLGLMRRAEYMITNAIMRNGTI